MNQNSKIIFALTIALTTVIFSGCATQGKSVGLGGAISAISAIGAGSGAIIGGIADPGKDGQYRTRNVIIGTAIGGVAGMATGALLHSNAEDKKREAYEQGKADANKSHESSGSMPNLQNPKVEARWIDGRIAGSRYIEGHFEYVIVEPARWEEK